MRSIAALTGLSGSTVTRALRNDPRITAATRLKVQRAARELGYTLNPAVSGVMSHIRRGSVSSYRGKIAWLNCEPEPGVWDRTPWLKLLFAGARQRAEQTGFLLEDFWLADPAINIDRAHEILKARGVQGLVIPKPSHYPHQLTRRFDWQDLACVTISNLSPPLPIHEVGPDELTAVRQSLTALRARGYKRIGLMLHAGHDRENQGACRAGYLLETADLPARAKIPVLMLPGNMTADDPLRLFAVWMDRHRPEAVICCDEHVLEWAEQLGRRVPTDLGLVHLDRHAYLKRWAGIDQQQDQIGAAAVDLVTAQLTRGEYGLPPFQKKVFIEGRWVEGGTVQPAP